MTGDLRRQLILAPPSVAFPQRLRGDHDQKRRRRGFHFGGAAVQALPDEIGAVCRNPGRRVRSGSGDALAARSRAVDGNARDTDARHRPPLPARIGCARSGGGPASQADDLQPARRWRIRPADLRKIADLFSPVFIASLERAIAAGDASRVGSEPLNLFWFAHHTLLMTALGRYPPFQVCPTATPPISNGRFANLFFGELDSTKPRLLPIWIARLSLVPGQPVTAEGG